ncbi:MAG: VCBS repeat-containing protein [Acidobacteriota bacterium]|nr:MAG: VCBS repeat-containing protein [Acidobacteriota bacterium]
MSRTMSILNQTAKLLRSNKRSFFRSFSLRFCLCWFLILTMVSQPLAGPLVAAPTETAAAPIQQTEIDLTISRLNAANLITDSQTLDISGELEVRVHNFGLHPTASSFRVIAFEDRNANETFEAATDLLLGQTIYTESLGPTRLVDLKLSIDGVVTFKGNLIYVVVDSDNAIAETNEGNNLRHTGQSNNYASAPTGQLNPIVEWTKDTFSVLPTNTDVGTLPVVVDLDGDKIPEIIFATDGILRAVRGVDGHEIWTVTNLQYRLSSNANVAVGDIDSDGRPEIIGVNSGGILAFEHDGTLKWLRNQTWNSFKYTLYQSGSPCIADLDNDGVPEIILGAAVFNNDGTLRWAGTVTDAFSEGLTLVSDLDLDGSPEIVVGRTAYRADGSVYWHLTNYPDGTQVRGIGFCAIGNFDEDEFPEVVLMAGERFGGGRLSLVEHNGQFKWGPVFPPDVTQSFGGPPTVADVDNDGQPEIGIAYANLYAVFETNGALKWQVETKDISSGVTGSSAFDFENDGSVEVAYADEDYLRIYRGIDGFELFKIKNDSGTLYEYPVIADVDADGQAEIVVIQNSYVYPQKTGKGLVVVGGGNRNWSNTRRIWNQHTYHITNVNENATIPRYEQPNWQVPGLNNYRLNAWLPGEGIAAALPDLIPSLIRQNSSLFPASTELTARIGNGGSASVNSGANVSFYRGDPATGGTLIGTAQTSRALPPGQFEDVKVIWNSPPTGVHPIVVVADDNGAGAGLITEGNELNNKATVNNTLGVGPFDLVNNLTARFKENIVDLRWDPVPGAVSYNIYRSTGTQTLQLLKSGHQSGIAGYADSGLLNGTTYYYTVRWVDADGRESGNGTEVSATPTLGADRLNNDVPPTIVSAPTIKAGTGKPYSHQMKALDPDANETLSWSLLMPPDGMMIGQTTGQISWVPNIFQGGYNTVRVRVEDSRGRFATQSYQLFVELENSAPFVDAGEELSAQFGLPVKMKGRVSDDGLPFSSAVTISWSKVSGPGDVVFDDISSPTSGASFRAVGDYVLRLTASDSQLTSSDEVSVTVVQQFASRTYTTDADFDEARLYTQNYDSYFEHPISKQLQLKPNIFINAFWEVTYDSKIGSAEWGRIAWDAQVCDTGSLNVSVASNDKNCCFNTYTPVNNGDILPVSKGRYLRIRVEFQRRSYGFNKSPILYNISVGTKGSSLTVPVNKAPTVDAGPDLFL